MKVAIAAATLAAVASANAASAPLAARNDYDCVTSGRGLAYERGFVVPLVQACREAPKQPGNPWSSPVCVAAAIAAGPAVLRDQVSCEDSEIGEPDRIPNLELSVYASIVGESCAKTPDPCRVTRQNFVDFVYGQIATAVKNPVWPKSGEELAKYYIDPIFRFSKDSPTADATIESFSDFNDWLHFAGNVGHCNEQDPSGCPPGELPPWQHA